jgi:GrpB-like predicted nucleotidyltransferase (UPF0157 family)
MKITIAPYQKGWSVQFAQISRDLKAILAGLDPVVEHVGSTAVEGLAAKPIIDINVGLPRAADLERAVERMAPQRSYIYYQAFNASMPQRRLFVKLHGAAEQWGFKPVYERLAEIPHEAIHEKRLAHVHVWVLGTADWIRHLAFRDYLRAHEAVKNEYQRLKVQLSQQEWQDGMEYNQAKDAFIKRVEAEAVNWYNLG